MGEAAETVSVPEQEDRRGMRRRVIVALFAMLGVMALYVAGVSFHLARLKAEIREAYRQIREMETAFTELEMAYIDIEELLFLPEFTEEMWG